MSAYTKSIPKGSDEYMSLAAKTNYARDYLLSLNARLGELILISAQNDERKSLADIEFEDIVVRRDKILSDPNLCYSDAEIEAFQDDNLPPRDMFVQIANDTSYSTEVRNAASDIASLEDSVADAKLAYEIDSADFDKVVDATNECISIAGEISNPNNPNLVKITPEDEERLRKANETIKALGSSLENFNLQEEAKKRAMCEIGKHPFFLHSLCSKEQH